MSSAQYYSVQVDIMLRTDDPEKKYRHHMSYGTASDYHEMIDYHARASAGWALFFNGRCVYAGKLSPLDIQRFTDAWKA